MSIQVVKIREFQGHSQAVYAICMDADPGRFYSAGADGMLVRWQLDAADGTLIARNDSAVYALYANSQYLMSGTREGVFSVFDIRDSRLLRHIRLSNSPIFDIIGFNGMILVASGEGKLWIMDHEFTLTGSIHLSGKSLRKMQVMGDHLAISSSDGVIRVLNASLDLVSELQEQNLSVFGLAYGQAQKKLISGGREAVLHVYLEGRHEKTIKAHLLHIHHIAMNEEQSMYLTCSMDKTIKLWDANDDRLLKVIDHERCGGHTSSVNKILWFGKNNFISCSDDRTLKCFEILDK